MSAFPSSSSQPPQSPNSGSRTPAALSWAAGFLDGEGCIHISKQHLRGRRSATYQLAVHIMQNDFATLEHFTWAVGIPARIYRVKRAANHSRQCYTLNYGGKAALELLALVGRYLVRKAREAQAAADFWTDGEMGRQRNGHPLAPEVLATRERYRLLLRSLK